MKFIIPVKEATTVNRQEDLTEDKIVNNDNNCYGLTMLLTKCLKVNKTV